MCYCYFVRSTKRDFRISSISELYRLQLIKVNYNSTLHCTLYEISTSQRELKNLYYFISFIPQNRSFSVSVHFLVD